jgi:hypothetical protein
VSDDAPPPLPQNAPYHPAPPQGWRPISKLAVTCFVLSLALILIALPGVWVIELLPLALGIVTLATVKATERRGRLLAIWGVVIAIGVGSCSYAFHAGMRGVIGGMAESMLAALSSNVPEKDKDAALDDWIHPPALEEDPELLAKIRARYARVVAAFGPYQDSIDLGSVFFGIIPLADTPENVVEISEEAKAPRAGRGPTLWVRASFERGTVHVSIELMPKSDENMQSLPGVGSSGTAAPIVVDVHFFRPRPAGGS